VTQRDDSVELDDRDPYDYARAQYSFPESPKVSVEFTVEPAQANRGRAEIEIFSMFGDVRPARIVMNESGRILAGNKELGSYAAKDRVAFRIDADAKAGSVSVKLNDNAATELPLVEPVQAFQRISFRTGEYRALGTKSSVSGGSDELTDPVKFVVRNVSVK
jgi:hypothetical protein